MSTVVTLDEAKKYLRIGGTSEDALIGSLITGCANWIEEFCGVKFGEARRTDSFDGGGKSLRVEKGPLRRVVSLSDRYSPGAAFVEDQDFFVAGDRIFRWGAGENAFGPDSQAPSARWPEGCARWLVAYDCGYQTDDSTSTTSGDDAPHVAVPNALKVALLELVRRAFDNRGGASSENAAGWKVDWQDFASSDVVAMLSPFIRADV